MSSQPTTGHANQTLVGIRGWLLLSAIGLIVALFLSAIGLLASLEQMMGHGFSAYSLIWLFVNLGMLAYLCFVAVSFFKKQENAPQNVVQYLITRLVVSVLLFVLGIALYGIDFTTGHFR
jgi:hypothetical protein